MTRTLKALSALVLGGMLIISTACEDKECKDALATTAGEAAAKAQASLTADLAKTKAALATSEAALAAAKRDLEAAKAPKAEEPAPAPAAKKGAKGAKK
jgi:hypothetical protein